jgi:RNA polymerase sigma-70 factor, ECF subfamily
VRGSDATPARGSGSHLAPRATAETPAGDASRSKPVIGERVLSDAVLAVAVARHDQSALAELHRRHGGSLFCVALRVLSVRELAEEVVHDVFLRLWRSPERFDPARGSLRSFLLALAHDRAVDIVRGQNARLRSEDGDAHERKTPSVVEDDILDFVIGQELRDAVGTLCRTEREAISLAYFGGRSDVKVASLLGIPQRTARSRIRSGLARLRMALIERGVDPSMTNRALW